MMRRIPPNPGPRTNGLLLCAFVWGLIGVGVLFGRGMAIEGTWHDHLPVWVRAAIWWAPAALSIALCRAPRHDWPAFTLLFIGPFVRLASYLTAWIAWLTGHGGSRYGWYSAAFCLALIGLVLLAASRTERGDFPSEVDS